MELDKFCTNTTKNIATIEEDQVVIVDVKECVEQLFRFKEDTEPELRDLQEFRTETEQKVSALQQAVFDKKKGKYVLTTVVSPIRKSPCNKTNATTETGPTVISFEDINTPQK